MIRILTGYRPGIFRGPLIEALLDTIERVGRRIRRPEVLSDVIGEAVLPMVKSHMVEILSGESRILERFRAKTQ